ncbi:Zn-ribbon domain-containing OB-fold protein [Kaustia mangrovi]|uniref:Zn-ribbon domain-containing OB-fold protein n=1 Tax=Kaustia mangrovi TaxID=2593653 RepID=A0A7S8C4B2_9HYPH|nr:Zn-ribbon domain-containing OB-fold protein [Kaustia mangrovi]QPC43098.1 Zn-ribbon domain-containing OB-fold protein [Kaustia mangrovi]
MSSYISLPIYQTSTGQRLRMEAGRCTACGTLAYPQRPVCASCGADSFETAALSGEGTLYTFTVIARGGAPAEFDDQQTMTGTIVVGVVALAEGPRIIAQLADVDPADLEIGTPLKAEIRRLYDQEGIVRYGTKFVPA